MMGPVAAHLSGGRLHLQHGPIDLIIGADGARDQAFAAAKRRFATVLSEVASELGLLRLDVRQVRHDPQGTIARRMVHAAQRFAAHGDLTPMAAVAGAVAEEILRAMTQSAPLTRAYVNNGGDIALHLGPHTSYRTAICDAAGHSLGHIDLSAGDGIGGIATSGQRGRSLSLGIADSVTVLARSVAEADVAATLIGNAVDLPGHPAIKRAPAQTVRDDSDLGDRLVVTHVGSLTTTEAGSALHAGKVRAEAMVRAGLITAASLHLQGHSVMTNAPHMTLKQKDFEHA